ncbi:30S ribosomal protein S17 [Ramicandelaber brevisporus]|nr:30S ribosomal protein S17 [Ramicandelaber brevisporus]
MRQNLIGIVVNTLNAKTAKVRVPRIRMHHKVHKEVVKHRNFMAHDELEKCKVGDIVRIEQCKKISERKYFSVAEIIRPGRTWTDPETGIVRH